MKPNNTANPETEIADVILSLGSHRNGPVDYGEGILVYF